MIKYNLKEEIKRVTYPVTNSESIELISRMNIDKDSSSRFYQTNHPSNEVYEKLDKVFPDIISNSYNELNKEFLDVEMNAIQHIDYNDISRIMIDYLLATVGRTIAYENALRLEDTDIKPIIIEDTAKLISVGLCIVHPMYVDSRIQDSISIYKVSDEYTTFSINGLPIKYLDGISPKYTVNFSYSKPEKMIFPNIITLDANVSSNIWAGVIYKISFSITFQDGIYVSTPNIL